MADLIRTSTPGVYKRGKRYVVVYRDITGRQRKESTRTLAEARKLKAARTADVARGEFHVASRERFRDYAQEWIERYQGQGRGFRENSRTEYRRLLNQFAIPYFGNRRLAEITPSDIAAFIGSLCDRGYADATVRAILRPVRSCFATAVREGKVRHNPCTGAALPHRQRFDDDQADEVRPFSRQQLGAFLTVVHPSYKLMFRFLAATGLRVSELLALRWRDLRLNGSEPWVGVRRAVVRGQVGPPKSKFGRRDVALSPALVSELRAWRKQTEWPADDDLVFASTRGTPRDPEWLRRKVIRPAAEEADAPWASFHTFRHTAASLWFASGANIVQVSRALGHHSPAFTLSVYTHLLPSEGAPALDVDAEIIATSEMSLAGTEEGPH